MVNDDEDDAVNVVVGGATGVVVIVDGETDVIGDCILLATTLPINPLPPPLPRKFEFIKAEVFEKSIIFS